MKVRYTETALREIDEICSYIARDNPDAAATVALRLIEQLRSVRSSRNRRRSCTLAMCGHDW